MITRLAHWWLRNHSKTYIPLTCEFHAAEVIPEPKHFAKRVRGILRFHATTNITFLYDDNKIHPQEVIANYLEGAYFRLEQHSSATFPGISVKAKQCKDKC